MAHLSQPPLPHMGSNAAATVAAEYPPFLRIHTDGRVERLFPMTTVPPSTDPATGVISVDSLLRPSTTLSARLFLPPLTSPSSKVSILLHFHGGGFCIGSAFGSINTAYLSSLSARAGALIVSVEYRLAPENPLPAAYEDAWESLILVASGDAHPWIAEHGDLARLFLIGDSAGANIVHRLAMAAGERGLPAGAGIRGMILCHPFFWGKEAVGGEPEGEGERGGVGRNWRMVCPGTSGVDDPWLNPMAEGARRVGETLACGRVLVCVAEADMFRWRGEGYYEMLAGGGWWDGVAELLLTEGEGHCFHLWTPTTEKALHLMDRVAAVVARC